MTKKFWFTANTYIDFEVRAIIRKTIENGKENIKFKSFYRRDLQWRALNLLAMRFNDDAVHIYELETEIYYEFFDQDEAHEKLKTPLLYKEYFADMKENAEEIIKEVRTAICNICSEDIDITKKEAVIRKKNCYRLFSIYSDPWTKDCQIT